MTEDLKSEIPNEILKKIENAASGRENLAQNQEMWFWWGSAVAAVCSAIAGVVVASNIAEKVPGGTIILGLLAIVPAVWAAIDRSLKLRQLSSHNYLFAARYNALFVKASTLNQSAKAQEISSQYADIATAENVALAALLLSDEEAAQKSSRNAPLTQISAKSSGAEQQTEVKNKDKSSIKKDDILEAA